MRSSALPLAVCAALALFASARPALAQLGGPTGHGFLVDRYVVPMQSGDLFWTERASVTPHLGFGGVTVFGYQRRPLTVRDGNDNHIISAIVENDARMHLAASFGLFDRLQFGAALPLVFFENGSGPQPNDRPAPSRTGVGDLRLDARARIFGDNVGPGFRLALATAVMFPTGDRDAFASDGYVTGTLRALGEIETRAGFRFLLNTGVFFRPTLVPSARYVYTVDDEIFARLAVSGPVVADRTLLASLEFAAATALAYRPGILDRAYTHFEVTIGAKYVSEGGMVAGIAVGVGLSPAVGTPDARVMLMIARGHADPAPNSRAPGDDDYDGVANGDDRCPRQAMGNRPDLFRRGCPERDRDGDGVVDELDACPNESAGTHRQIERVGCPVRSDDHGIPASDGAN